MHAAARILYDAAQHFSENDGWAIASHVALSILASMFPFLIFLAALAGFLGSKSLADEAMHILMEAWPPQVAGPIGREIQDVLTQARGGALTLGVVLSVFFSSNSVGAFRIALGRAYGVKDTRPWWWLQLLSILYVFIGALTLLTLAVLVVLAPLIWTVALYFFPHLAPLDHMITFLRLAITSLVLLAALILAHKYLPAGHRTLREIAPGVLLTYGLWIAAGVAFGSYLAEFARNYVTTYAGLASAMIAIVFLYWIAVIFILGGELNAAILRAREKARRPAA